MIRKAEGKPANGDRDRQARCPWRRFGEGSQISPDPFGVPSRPKRRGRNRSACKAQFGAQAPEGLTLAQDQRAAVASGNVGNDGKPKACPVAAISVSRII